MEEISDKFERQKEDNSGNEGLLKVEIESLRKTINALENQLSHEKQRHI